MRALGLMSGTSMDGISVALVDTDGETVSARGPAMTFAYNSHERAAIARAMGEARAMTTRGERPGSLAETEAMLTERHAAAIADFLAAQGVARADIDVVGFHGQTVLHRPDEGLTVQLGDGAKLAELCGLTVVHDLRARDVAAGGQGAPLVPVYHRALVAGMAQRPVAIVNIGGVANVTYIGRDGALTAFDTGPGNALLDDWMMKRAGVAYDRDGVTSGDGTADEAVLRFCLSHSFFAEPPPKSLDRNAFIWDVVEWMTLEDGAATLAAFTVAGIAKAREHFPEEPALWIVAGGGRKNRTIMSGLAGLVQNAVVPAEAVGLDGDALEAEAWAYLAVRALKGLAITFPGTTGVPEPLTGGVISRPVRALG
ncbi:MAG: anhydro-N-acetylmuramic acid kinase [Hyphomicrobium sp. 32-62-53]|nr:MAG: anhydro-N-acetylmuramic acid kinase [Hyphomicrobium sp. 12-62-95]OYY00658.1 MAG: anhydro-N-acetylmuramic acid kinase [Hyphomicrobium sp. 32-62-53]